MRRREFLELLAGAGLVALGCPLTAGRRPHVVCILVDQLRKDAFEAWAPRTNELAARGIVFEQMRAVAPWTYPSVISMMSGLDPQQHGADGHATADVLTRFGDDVPLLQQALARAGYHTAAFVTNPFLRDWNPFHRGFDAFHADFVRDVGNRRPEFHEFAIPEKMFGESVNRAVRRHFDARPLGSPEFSYIHYIDVHGPWTGAPFPPTYPDAVRYIDLRIFELYSYFMRRYDGELLFFVTSYHGLALGDDLLVGYGPEWREMKQSVHDFNLRIPFVLLPSEAVHHSGRIDTPCSNVDFTPTLLDLLDIAPSTALRGRSLARYIRAEAGVGGDAARAIYARVSAFGSRSDCVVVGTRKYMRFFDVDSDAVVEKRIFDLERDPRETQSIGSEFGPVDALIEDAAGGHGLAFAATPAELAGDVEDQLRALGYIEGARSP